MNKAGYTVLVELVGATHLDGFQINRTEEDSRRRIVYQDQYGWHHFEMREGDPGHADYQHTLNDRDQKIYEGILNKGI